MVPQTSKDDYGRPGYAAAECDCATLQRRVSSSSQDTQTFSVPCLREPLTRRGIPQNVANLLVAAWRDSTQAQYKTHIERWLAHCRAKQIDPYCPMEIEILLFLTMLFECGLSYSSINTARSALSSFLDNVHGCTVGNLPIVKRLLRGVFQLRPPEPRYHSTWDVNLVLNYLDTLFPLNELSLKFLSYKLVMLIILLSAQRVQTLSKLDISHMFVSENKIIFTISNTLKQSKPGRFASPIELELYEKESLCVVRTLREYLSRTEDKRHGQDALLISYLKPYKAVTPNTISRWIKNTMTLSGINTELFKSHSTRAASTSAAKKANVNIDQIMKTAGWKNASTFAKFYNKTIVDNDFANALLNRK